MRGEFLDVGGSRLYYYAIGSRGAGEPIVLIHGFPASGHLWRDVAPLLPEGHRVVVADLLGYGRSDPPGSARVDIRSHADRVLAMMDQLGITVACLVGHGLGGGVAQSLTVRFPQRVSRLCLVNSVAFNAWPPRVVKAARASLPVSRHLPGQWLLSMARSEMLRGYVDHEVAVHDVDLFLRPFSSESGHDAFVAHLDALDNRETSELSQRLKEIVAPTAIVWGEEDPFLPLSVGQRLHESIRGSTLHVIRGGRHYIPRESSHDLAAATAALLAR